MLTQTHPMRVALALIATMLSLAALYAALYMHVVAIFQVLIYVGAVMVFMVYAIMLLDRQDRVLRLPLSKMKWPGILGFVAVLLVLSVHLQPSLHEGLGTLSSEEHPFALAQFAQVFLNDYWLYFELASVLLVVAVVAVVAVLKAPAVSHDG